MIVREFYETRDDGVNLYRTYSDAGFYILQTDTNAKYAEAIDIETATYTYTETDELIEPYEDTPVPEPEITEEPAPAPPVDPVTLEEWKMKKLADIDEYDASPAVNCFYYNGNPMWLDRETRASLRNTIESLTLVGRETLSIWYGETQITLNINIARQLLAVLEVYATDCYNVTVQHKIAVEQLTSINAVMNFDITADYPEMPDF